MIATPANPKKLETLADRLAAHGGHGPGFDTLRLFLSFSVMTWHSVSFCYGINFGLSVFYEFLRVPVALIVPCFFALSGFLVAGSMERLKSLPSFIIFRALRILPALAVVVCLTALVLGPILTTFSLKGYFSDPRFLSYFVNIIGGMRFWLPGLFVDNPYDVVNISLWTVGNEMGCYVLVAALMLAGVTRRRRLMLSGLIIAAIILTGTAYWDGRTSADDLLGKPMLFMCFMWGDILYRWRDLIPLSGTLAVLAVLFYSTIAWFLLPLVPGIGSLMVAYLTVYLGHQSLPRPGFLARGDYSYGIYLYASPVQQTIIQLLPSARYFFVDVLLATPIVLLLAAFSWHVIERPALSLRKRFAPSRALLAGSLLNRS